MGPTCHQSNPTPLIRELAFTQFETHPSNIYCWIFTQKFYIRISWEPFLGHPIIPWWSGLAPKLSRGVAFKDDEETIQLVCLELFSKTRFGEQSREWQREPVASGFQEFVLRNMPCFVVWRLQTVKRRPFELNMLNEYIYIWVTAACS